MNYIKYYDGMLSKEYCQFLIEIFNGSENVKEVNTDIISFSELNISKEFPELNMDIIELFNSMVKRYITDCLISYSQFPKTYSFEEIRMKKYLPDKDYFDNHVDCYNIESSKRFLVMFIYLDDNEEGMTEFTELGISIKPEVGRIVIFPPMWNYPHTAHKAVNKPKYIIGSYLHYAI